MLAFLVTNRCNARCLMCSIWKQENQLPHEISVGEFDRILADPLFKHLRVLNLNGGEPTLRSDLPELAAVALRRYPLQQIGLVTNGLSPRRLLDQVDSLLKLVRDTKTRFGVCMSLHGIGDIADKVRQMSGTFEKAVASLEGLAERPEVDLSVNCVITPVNIKGVRDFMEWGEKHALKIRFALGEVRERFYNQGLAQDVLLESMELKEVIRLFEELGRRTSFQLPSNFRYVELAGMLKQGTPRRLACMYYLGGAVLGADGTLFYCPHSRPLGNCLEKPPSEIFDSPDNLHYFRKLRLESCPRCPPYTLTRMELEVEWLRVLGYILRTQPTPFKSFEPSRFLT
jgi:MoaA/NifB/PqqE/SkfB family radical SAM enzyme